MNVIMKAQFKRDQANISNTELLLALETKLLQIEKAERPDHVTGLKSLTGFTTHYRIYVKTEKHSYRIGAIIRGNTIWLVRFLSRKKIYQRFP